MRRIWKLIAISGPILAGVSIFISALAYRSIQDQRADRIKVANRNEFLSCTRDNEQDKRDRSQDTLLLHLLDASLDAPPPPGTANTPAIKRIMKVFNEERFILKNRVKSPGHSPCEDLPGAPQKIPQPKHKAKPTATP